jgi:hypothetical protein
MRGLKGGSSLFRVLVDHHHIGLHRRLPAITVAQIFDWADAHFEKFAQPPSQTSGRIPKTRVTWGAIDQMLVDGYRGLPGGSSLSLLLDGRYPVRSRHPPPLKIKDILVWAKAYHRKHKKWPTQKSSGFAGNSGITWGAVHQALRGGYRGLPGGLSLARVLDKYVRRSRRRIS